MRHSKYGFILIAIFAMLFLASVIAGRNNVCSASSAWCSNEASGSFSQVYVEAYITGSSPSTSSGYGYAEGAVAFEGVFCAIDNYMIVLFNSSYGYYGIRAGPIDNSYYKDFPSGTAGTWILSEIEYNFCDGILTAVTALLYGGCVK